MFETSVLRFSPIQHHIGKLEHIIESATAPSKSIRSAALQNQRFNLMKYHSVTLKILITFYGMVFTELPYILIFAIFSFVLLIM